MKKISIIFVGCLVFLIMALSSAYAAMFPVYPDINTGPMNWRDSSQPGSNPAAFTWLDDQRPFGAGGDYTLFFYADSECDIMVGQLTIQNNCYATIHPCNARAYFDPGVPYYYVVVDNTGNNDDDEDDDEDEDDNTTDPIQFTIDFSDINFASLGCETILKCKTDSGIAQDNCSFSNQLKKLWKSASSLLFSPSTAHASLNLPGYVIVLVKDPAGAPVVNANVRLDNSYYGYTMTTEANGCDLILVRLGTYQVSVEGAVHTDFYPSQTVVVDSPFKVTGTSATIY